MTARTPLATLTMARSYLDSLWAGITPGPWANRIGMSLSTDEPDRMVSFAQMSENKHFILALHATAPAIQLLLSVEIGALCFTADEDGDGTADNRVLSIAEALLSTPHASQWITGREATQ